MVTGRASARRANALLKAILGLALCATACTEGDDRVDDFIGAWQYSAGSTTITSCYTAEAGHTSQTTDLSGRLVLTAGTTSDLVEPTDVDSCPALLLDVAGRTASLQEPHDCTVTTGSPPQTITQHISITEHTIELDASSTTVAISGEATSSLTGAITATCSATFVGGATQTDP